MKKYLIDFFDAGTFEELRTDCKISIGVSAHSLERNEENDRISYGNHEYTDQLLAAYRDRDTMLRLSELNCEEIYNLYPMIASFRLSIDDRELSGEEKAVHEKTVQDRVLEMIQAIQSETDDTCNLVVEVVSANSYADLYDGADSWLYYILQGEQMEMERESNTGSYDSERAYALAHAYAYEGIYW